MAKLDHKVDFAIMAERVQAMADIELQDSTVVSKKRLTDSIASGSGTNLISKYLKYIFIKFQKTARTHRVPNPDIFSDSSQPVDPVGQSWTEDLDLDNLIRPSVPNGHQRCPHE